MNFMLLKQKIIGGGEEEPADFKEKADRVENIKAALVSAVSGLNAWGKGIDTAAQGAKSMAETLKTVDSELAEIGLKISAATGDEASEKPLDQMFNSIQKKLDVFADLKKKRGTLETKRLERNRLERKLHDAEKKSKRDELTIQKFQNELTQAKRNHDDLYSEIVASYDFLIEEAGTSTGINIIKAEIAFFKVWQANFFHQCSDIFKNDDSDQEPGNIAGEYSDWSARLLKVVSAAYDTRVQSTRSLLPPAGAGAAAAAVPISAAAAGAPPPPPPPGGGPVDYSAAPGTTAAIASPPPPPPPTRDDVVDTPPAVYARALYEYAAQNDDELSLGIDDLIVVTEQMDDGWWEGECNGRTGVFPANYVQLCEEGNDQV